MALRPTLFFLLALMFAAQFAADAFSAVPEISMEQLLTMPQSMFGKVVSVTACMRPGVDGGPYLIICGLGEKPNPEHTTLGVDDSPASLEITKAAMRYLDQNDREEVKVKIVGALLPDTSRHFIPVINTFYPRQLQVVPNQ